MPGCTSTMTKSITAASPGSAPEVAYYTNPTGKWRLVALTSAIITRAFELERQHSLHYWDALILAAARADRCEHLFTEDFQPSQAPRHNGAKLRRATLPPLMARAAFRAIVTRLRALVHQHRWCMLLVYPDASKACAASSARHHRPSWERWRRRPRVTVSQLEFLRSLAGGMLPPSSRGS